MSGRVEKLLKAYPEMIQQRDCLAYQLAHFQGVSVGEIIDSMMTPQAGGERVQSGGLSNRTERIALEYRERQERINRAWYAHLEQKLQLMNERIQFIESAVAALPSPLSGFMFDYLKGQFTWDQLAEKHNLSRATVGRYRRQAIVKLDNLLANHERELEEYLLS